MSTETAVLLAGLNEARVPAPLIAIDGGRFPGLEVASIERFESCRLPKEARAGWLLYAGFGAHSHSVSQDLSSPEGSYWHGIYHRMEPDAWNAKYWFRQVGTHPIAEALVRESRDAGWNPGRNWDHARFVDFVGEALASNHPQTIALASQVQWLEWRLLFDYCVKDFSQ